LQASTVKMATESVHPRAKSVYANPHLRQSYCEEHVYTTHTWRGSSMRMFHCRSSDSVDTTPISSSCCSTPCAQTQTSSFRFWPAWLCAIRRGGDDLQADMRYAKGLQHLQLADVVDGLLQKRSLVQLVLVRNQVPQLIKPAENRCTTCRWVHSHARS
jgi:hypothetical protein